jgi:hypothetical protein
MNSIGVIVLAALMISGTQVPEQNATPQKPAGAVNSDTTWSDDCLGLQYKLPDGWEFRNAGQAKPGQESNKQKLLFRTRKASVDGKREAVEVELVEAPLQHPILERLAALFAVTYSQTTGSKITKDAYPVTIAGRSFARSDLSNGDKMRAVVVTWYRGYAVLAWAFAGSSQDLDDAVNSLNSLTFGEDKRAADCFSAAK